MNGWAVTGSLQKVAAVVAPGDTTMMDGWGVSGWGWFWMSLMLGIGMLLLALLMVALFRGPSPSSWAERHEDAGNILAKRLARGEIDEAEYRRLRNALEDRQRSEELT